MVLERLFYKWYKKINISMDEKQTNSRLSGIKNALGSFNDPEKISQLLKMYYRLSVNSAVKEEFVDYFVKEDMSFDEENNEEIVILAGATLANLLEGEHKIFVAFSILILDKFYDTDLVELSDMANSIIKNAARENKNRKSAFEEVKTLSSKEIEDIFGDTVEVTEEEAEKLISIIKSLNSNIERLLDVITNENDKYHEDVEILSWIVGEWSNILERPLSEVSKVNGAFVIGAELSDLVLRYPGPYPVKAFIKKMLDKCIKEDAEILEISLSEFIDRQDEELRKLMFDNYGNACGKRNLLVLSAVEMSLAVDEPKQWIPAYKKAWKINPDEIKYDLLGWSEVIYQECMLNAY